MALFGLGKNKSPFLYLDNFIGNVDWPTLHAETSFGISQSTWHKKFVSSGVHSDWADKEITPYMRSAETRLSEQEFKFYNMCTTIDEKIKYINALSHIPHPFWVIFIRNNRRIESSGIQNKSISKDCEWALDSKNFPSLVNLINSMPFEEVGRVIIFMTEANNQTVPHFDGRTQNDRPNDDFIWFTTTDNRKNIFVMDGDTKEKIYSDTNRRFVWFNEMDYHGTDPVPEFSFSIRIDGKFKEDVKNLI
jgi:hypothetical protein